jgi:hypothetical protein
MIKRYYLGAWSAVVQAVVCHRRAQRPAVFRMAVGSPGDMIR